jgi:hypothetical protein
LEAEGERRNLLVEVGGQENVLLIELMVTLTLFSDCLDISKVYGFEGIELLSEINNLVRKMVERWN